jgi:hypothetical protein
VFNSNAAVGTGFDHVRGDNVYPVTTLSGATPALPLASSCSILTNLQIAANSKFLRAGTLTVYHGSGASPEQISYTNSTTVGGTTTLTGLTRCANGTSFVAAASGDPVASMVVGAGTNDLEVSISSTGNVGSTQRQEYKVVQRLLP